MTDVSVGFRAPWGWCPKWRLQSSTTMAQEGHSPVLVFDSPVVVLHSPVMVLHSLILVFTQSSFNFYAVQFYFLHSPVLFFYTVQFYFYTVNTQSSFIFCVVTRPLSLYCNTCYLTAAILYFLETMDSIIRHAVREELRRSSCLSSSGPETASSTNQDDQGRSENKSDAAGSSRSPFSSRTVGRCFLNEDPKTKTQDPLD